MQNASSVPVVFFEGVRTKLLNKSVEDVVLLLFDLGSDIEFFC